MRLEVRVKEMTPPRCHSKRPVLELSFSGIDGLDMARLFKMALQAGGFRCHLFHCKDATTGNSPNWWGDSVRLQIWAA